MPPPLLLHNIYQGSNGPASGCPALDNMFRAKELNKHFKKLDTIIKTGNLSKKKVLFYSITAISNPD